MIGVDAREGRCLCICVVTVAIVMSTMIIPTNMRVRKPSSSSPMKSFFDGISVRRTRWCWGGGGVMGRVNQVYRRLSTTHGHITDCKLDSVVHADVCGCSCGEFIQNCLGCAERTTLDSFWVPSRRLNAVIGEQKWIARTILLTPSRSAGSLTH